MNLSAQASSLAVGKITGSYGIKGWVKIHAFTEQRESFVQLGKWYIKQSQSSNESIEAIPFDEFKLHGKGLVAHITGVDDRTEAETYKGLELVAGPDALPTLGDGDFYWHQLEGLKVWCTEGDERVLLGIVDHLIETGANDVLVIRPCEGSPSDQPKERLVPYLPGSTVTNVDLALGTLEIDWFLEED